MPRKFDTAVVTIGIDPGKNTLHLVGLDARGEIVLREKVARTKIVSRLANVPPVATLAVPSVENRRIVSSSSEVQPGWHLIAPSKSASGTRPPIQAEAAVRCSASLTRCRYPNV
jgi:hypothetical protein